MEGRQKLGSLIIIYARIQKKHKSFVWNFFAFGNKGLIIKAN